MRKSFFSWLTVLMMSLLLAACSDSGGGTPITPGTNPPGTQTGTGTDINAPTPPPPATTPEAQANTTPKILTGIFVDAPVEGLSFVSGAQSGTTDAAGTFKFEEGGNVQFKVGNVVIGQASGKPLMTQLDLVKAVDATATVADPRVIQITQFLMTVNASAVVTKMTIPALVATAAQNEATVDLSQAQIDIATILGRITTHPVVTPAAAAAHLTTALATFTTAQIIGKFAAVDSQVTPTLGLSLNVVPNLAGTGFDVTGVAASTSGPTWSIAGTMGTDGSMQATGTGTGTTPPASMVITGAMTAATQITATANFTLNNAAKQVPVIFEKAVTPLLTGKLALPADAGVAAVAGDLVHIGADMTINADGTVSAHVARGQVTGIVALAAIYSDHFAGLDGVVTSTGNIIAIGGTPGAGESLNINGKATTSPSPVTIFTGSLNTVAGTASIKMMATDLNTAIPAATTLSFVKAANALVGVYQGTHTDTAPGLQGTFTFAVNNDNSAHGFAMFLRDRPALGIVQQSPFLLEGAVTPATGALAPPPGFNLGVLGGTIAVFPGLVMIDQEGVTKFTPGTFAGTIAGGAVSGTWQTGPVLATGTFTGILLP